MRKHIFICLTGLLLCSLTACGMNSLMHSQKKQREDSVEGFKHALRFDEYQVAASYLVPEHRAAFLELFRAMEKDLTIVDVRIEEITVLGEGEKVDVFLEFDYYLLPSVAVKTFRFDHTWVIHKTDPERDGVYLIETPFPVFP